MSNATFYEPFSKRLAAGERLTREEIEKLATTHDILSVGMLADEARRRAFGGRVTFVRVASCAFDKPLTEAVPLTAREVRLTGTPRSLEVAIAAIRSAKAVAGKRLLSGFSVVDAQTMAGGESLRRVLERLREAGLDRLAEVPVDQLESPRAVLDALTVAGYERIRLTISRPATLERVNAVLSAAELSRQFPNVDALNPLPLALTAFRPTTGYVDVKIVAIARLAAAADTHIQVDWQRYGPKLAQVALTFGADDLDNVTPSDEAPDGRRRAPLEEVRRNVETAGFSPVERDGRFVTA
jgi:aminodeoxyfutalosine synthase